MQTETTYAERVAIHQESMRKMREVKYSPYVEPVGDHERIWKDVEYASKYRAWAKENLAPVKP